MTGNTRETLRVGSVPFLNAKPLIRCLNTSEPPPLELTLAVPTRLTRMMKRNALDVALMPSIEYFRSNTYKIISDISISADGAVESVLIFSKGPLSEIRSLALDETSRTSVALAKILLKRKLGALPEFTECTPHRALGDISADAMLLIGDAAMTFRSNKAPFVLDLGQEWKNLTGLPFVFAMWVAQSDIDTGALRQKLLRARDEGLARLDEIAIDASNDLGLSVQTCADYLKNVMRYELGKREIEALSLFHKLAAEDGLCPEGRPIVFDH